MSSESNWYPLTQDFKIIESCDNIPDTNECQELTYTVRVETTLGQLQIDTGDQISVTQDMEIEGRADAVNEKLASIKFSPPCDITNPGAQNVVILASAYGDMAKTMTNVKFTPGTTFKTVTGTTPQQVYYASHQMNAFSTTQVPVYGRVVDLLGSLLSAPAGDTFEVVAE